MSTNGHREQASRVQAEADAADVDAAWDAQAELFRDWGLPVPQRPRVQWPKRDPNAPLTFQARVDDIRQTEQLQQECRDLLRRMGRLRWPLLSS